MIKQVAAQALSALDFQHNTLNLVHVDIKPGNIMIEINFNDIPYVFAFIEKRTDSTNVKAIKSNYSPFINIKLIDLNGAIEKGNKGAIV